MPFVKSGSGEFLLVGRGGRLENRGIANQTWLAPGSIWIRVPASKVEAAFEFTQETRDGIPLRFKGIFVYRVTDPVDAALHFDFWNLEQGVAAVTALLTHILLGELRDAVSHLSMPECIEGRKTTLTGVATAALQSAVQGGDSGAPWGIVIEAAQVSQVFIVDAQLRGHLEAETRNAIRLKAEQSEIRTKEQAQLVQLGSQTRVEEQQLAKSRDDLRRSEELELAKLGSQARVEEQQLAKGRDDLRRAEELEHAQTERARRKQASDLETARQALALEQERFAAQMAADEARLAIERPVRLAKVAQEREALEQEVELRELQRRIRALEVERDLLQERAEQELQLQLLPVEQAPQIVEAASRVLQGANLSVYGDDARLLGQLEPIFELLARQVRVATAAPVASGSSAGAG